MDVNMSPNLFDNTDGLRSGGAVTPNAEGSNRQPSFATCSVDQSPVLFDDVPKTPRLSNCHRRRIYGTNYNCKSRIHTSPESSTFENATFETLPTQMPVNYSPTHSGNTPNMIPRNFITAGASMSEQWTSKECLETNSTTYSSIDSPASMTSTGGTRTAQNSRFCSQSPETFLNPKKKNQDEVEAAVNLKMDYDVGQKGSNDAWNCSPSVSQSLITPLRPVDETMREWETQKLGFSNGPKRGIEWISPSIQASSPKVKVAKQRSLSDASAPDCEYERMEIEADVTKTQFKAADSDPTIRQYSPTQMLHGDPHIQDAVLSQPNVCPDSANLPKNSSPISQISGISNPLPCADIQYTCFPVEDNDLPRDEGPSVGFDLNSGITRPADFKLPIKLGIKREADVSKCKFRKGGFAEYFSRFSRQRKTKSALGKFEIFKETQTAAELGSSKRTNVDGGQEFKIITSIQKFYFLSIKAEPVDTSLPSSAKAGISATSECGILCKLDPHCIKERTLVQQLLENVLDRIRVPADIKVELIHFNGNGNYPVLFLKSLSDAAFL